MKTFRNFKAARLIPSMVILLAYPTVKSVISEHKALVFSDTLFIMSMFFVIVGVIHNLYLKGNFDNTSFVIDRFMHRETSKSYETYMKDVKERRKDSFNYPLLAGFIGIILSVLVSLFV